MMQQNNLPRNDFAANRLHFSVERLCSEMTCKYQDLPSKGSLRDAKIFLLFSLEDPSTKDKCKLNTENIWPENDSHSRIFLVLGRSSQFLHANSPLRLVFTSDGVGVIIRSVELMI